ncbi:hypothetical protein EDD86DRAFT_193442 [Gorgonomyces haynaldii]|nr:hypothetical protein EDD86DRAFT_193442 [Gorgonomyces haynaldii]
MADIVELDYIDLVNPEIDMNDQIAKAFGNGPDCKGALFVKNVPGLLPMRERLLKTASVFAALPDSVKKSVEHPESVYSFGWSHGKEIMNGKPDFAKGSYYNNPIYDTPSNSDPEYLKKYPEYAHPNLWPKELPELQQEFMELGNLIVSVGKLVARRCDIYLSKHYPELVNFMEDAIEKSTICKARLLHYFPMSEKDVEPTPDGGNLDSWCGLHVDHSMLTGLTSAMYIDESSTEYNQVDKSNPDLVKALEPAGLYIQTRGDTFVQAKIPFDRLAFQIGEAAQIASRGLLVATPHLVRGAAYPNVARNTFAVFMQPNVDHQLLPDLNFDQFTKEVMQRHYKM